MVSPKRSEWQSDLQYRITGDPPKCWSCGHYNRRIVTTVPGKPGRTEHRCAISRNGFPGVGRHCPAYVYEPGADALEFEAI